MVQITNTTKPITDVRGRTATFTQGVSSPVAVFQEMKSPAIAVRTPVGGDVARGSVLTIDDSGDIVKAGNGSPVIGVAAKFGTTDTLVDIITTGEIPSVLVDNTAGNIDIGATITMVGSTKAGVAVKGVAADSFAITRQGYNSPNEGLVSAYFIR